VRFPGATHLVVGFESRAEAERFLMEFRERLAKFGLELHPEKTRLIEFGRFAALNRKHALLSNPSQRSGIHSLA
jgi:RNA-directed DNA polymerase